MSKLIFVLDRWLKLHYSDSSWNETNCKVTKLSSYVQIWVFDSPSKSTNLQFCLIPFFSFSSGSAFCSLPHRSRSASSQQDVPSEGRGAAGSSRFPTPCKTSLQAAKRVPPPPPSALYINKASKANCAVLILINGNVWINQDNEVQTWVAPNVHYKSKKTLKNKTFSSEDEDVSLPLRVVSSVPTCLERVQPTALLCAREAWLWTHSAAGWTGTTRPHNSQMFGSPAWRCELE